MKGIKAGSLLAVGITAAVVLAGCGTTGGETGGDVETYTIGYQGPLTGDYAAYGENAKAGIEVAVAEFNAEHPDIVIETSYGDSQGDGSVAPGVAGNLIDDDSVLGVVGPAFSGETEATAPLYTEAGLTLISPSATRVSLTENGWTAFHRVVASDFYQGGAVVQYLTDEGYENVFIVDDASAYGAGLAEEITAGIGDILIGSDTIQAGDTDFSATVTRIKDAGADVVYFAGYTVEASLLIKQLKDSGYTGAYGTDDGAAEEPYFTAGDWVEGTFVSFPGSLSAGDDFAASWDAVESDDKGVIGAYTLEAYDAAKVFLDGIAEGNVTREDIATWVAGYDAEGLTKHISFTETGEVTGAKVIWVYEVVDAAPANGVKIELDE